MPTATWSDYHAAVTRFVSAIDGVLERGRAAELRYEVFLRQHGLAAGEGEQRLHAARIPAPDRHCLLGLLRLTRSAHETLGGALPVRPAPGAGAAARALACRHRI